MRIFGSFLYKRIFNIYRMDELHTLTATRYHRQAPKTSRANTHENTN